LETEILLRWAPKSFLVRDSTKTLIHRFDVIVLGAGAAGLMCAIEAAKRGRRVAVPNTPNALEKRSSSPAAPLQFHQSAFGRRTFSRRIRTFKSALARHTPEDFLARIKKHHIPYHEKTDGQLFCDRSARDVVTMLEQECRPLA
jgi:predicted flavoprotein YhiN